MHLTPEEVDVVGAPGAAAAAGAPAAAGAKAGGGGAAAPAASGPFAKALADGELFEVRRAAVRQPVRGPAPRGALARRASQSALLNGLSHTPLSRLPRLPR